MNTTRRSFLRCSGAALLSGFAGTAGLRPARAADAVEIRMEGTPGGARVWFTPVGLLVEPGQTIRWTNHDRGNSHTATAYAQRIPAGAQAWDSGFLLPDESFSVRLTVPGVYDYYCLPHQHAGMVGRIIVGQPEPQGWPSRAESQAHVPPAALAAFPAIDRIMSQKTVD